MTTTLEATLIGAPFPGLRAFEAEEALLFYGRETHVAELLDRLGDSHFVAVTGTSGSGKSSLVRAGLRPALHRGYLVDATSRWRFATMRPGGTPLDNMAAALASTFDTPRDELLRSLRSTSAGLSQAVARAGLGAGESLLIIADQFEELFRYDVTRAQQSDASLFVSQLLEATEQRDTAIYVVVTMRSEFLGRSSEFTGLAEAFNRSQYLVPRLTRDERREAIERPLRLVGTTPAPALVQQVLNDAGDDPDQLPVLQHVLLRTYREWERAGATGRIELTHYERVGGIEHALDVHGNEILAELSEPAQSTAARLFRSLTVAQGGVALRRPRRMQQLYDVAGASTPDARREVDHVIGRFASHDNSFLMLSSKELAPSTVVDITHESLIRKWKKLEAWVREETRSAEWYADLSRDVERYRTGEVSLWQDPELSGIQRRSADEGWNEAWANQYRKESDPPYTETLTFLASSARAAADERRSKRRAQIVKVVLGVLVIVTGIALYQAFESNQRARELSARAESAAASVNQANARLGQLENERKTLASAASSGRPADNQRLSELSQQIEQARLQAKAREDELARAKKNQEVAELDRGGLLKQIDALQQRVSQANTERDRLQQQLNSYQTSPQKGAASTGADERVTTLQKQLDDERKISSGQAEEIARLRTENASLRNAKSNAVGGISVQDLTKAFGDGVRNYELKNLPAAVQSLRTAVQMQSGVSQPPKEVRLSGTRFVPLAPQSYLAVALFDSKADCKEVAEALRGSSSESAPPEIRGRLDAARKACP